MAGTILSTSPCKQFKRSFLKRILPSLWVFQMSRWALTAYCLGKWWGDMVLVTSVITLREHKSCRKLVGFRQIGNEHLTRSTLMQATVNLRLVFWTRIAESVQTSASQSTIILEWSGWCEYMISANFPRMIWMINNYINTLNHQWTVCGDHIPASSASSGFIDLGKLSTGLSGSIFGETNSYRARYYCVKQNHVSAYSKSKARWLTL